MVLMLLDSQVVLWVLDDSPRLGGGARAAIERATFVHVSAATVWELTIKSMLGRLDLPPDFAAALPVAGFTDLPVTADDAAAIVAFPELARHDPFDRLLMAQAARRGMRLLTADDVLLDQQYDFVVDARS